ncbi:MAG: HAD family hydrolase [Actinobacteria bacterium]|nr:MAG: HAD family hydrolase [Actinomycetota bacterium]
MHESRAGVLFDLDGTLVDTNYLHTLAWSRALHDVGMWAPMNAIHRLVGMGGDQLVPRLLGHDVPGASDARSRRYNELLGEVRAFPGAAELLRNLHNAGVAVVLATSSPPDELDAKQDVDKSKPAPDLFHAAMRAGMIEPARALAVGDSVWDLQAARAAGLGCVGVETGGFSQHELAEAGALHVYQDVREIGRQLLTGPLATLLSG